MGGRKLSAKANLPFSRAHLETNDLTLQPGARVTTALLEVQEGSRDRGKVNCHDMSTSPGQVGVTLPLLTLGPGERRKPWL